ncbi:MAG: lipid-A-disaccharide synthase [Verrucomicrobiae bacterium]|nr:lipid-A-disaccharide synthase [Verrucomicrobiae bacterium]
MRVFLIAGEASGDHLGADLIEALRQRNPAIECYGAGGERMLAAGQRQSLDLASHGVIGIWDVLRQYPKYMRFFSQMVRDCSALQPDAIVLIDYPGFNMRFMDRIRPILPTAKIIYYVSPQVWAWKPGRAALLEKRADLLLSILPFEEAWYKDRAPKLKVVWVGHPILDRLLVSRGDDRDDEGLSVALLPGSREKEVSRHLPVMLRAAAIMAESRATRFICLAPNDRVAERVKAIIAREVGCAIDVRVRVGYSATHMSRCHLALVTSGTATLECAVAGTPMVVYYLVGPFTYFPAKFLVKVPYLAMVNLLLNRAAVPELIHIRPRPAEMARAALDLLSDRPRMEKQREDLERAIGMLGGPGASSRAAKEILDLSY